MEIKLQIGDREFTVPIKLLLNMARNFPRKFPGSDGNYSTLVDALIKLNLASVNQALASSRQLNMRQKKFLLEHGDIDTKRILFRDSELVNHLDNGQFKYILAINDEKMLINMAKRLRWPEEPGDLGFIRWPSEAVAREFVERLVYHPNSEVRNAVLFNRRIPEIYFPSSYDYEILKVHRGK